MALFAYLDPAEGSRMVQAFMAGALLITLIVVAVAATVLVLRRR
jgi:hypothetical protein